VGDVRVGVIVRALRRRHGWRQVDLASHAFISQQVVSLIERGHLEAVSLRALRRVLGTLEAQATIDIRWHGGQLDRLVDEAHASVVSATVRRLRRLGWEVEVEVTYSIYGERGSIDLLAWRGPQRALLVIEVKTEVTSTEATLRKHDEKVRLGRAVAAERFGWNAGTVSRLLVLPDTSTARRRMAASEVLSGTYPVRAGALRDWLRRPNGSISGLLFLPVTTVRSAGRRIDPPRRSGWVSESNR